MHYPVDLKGVFLQYYQEGLLYGITDQASPNTLVRQARILAEANVKIIQYRNKNATAQEGREDLLQIKELQTKHSFILIVNDSISLAKELDLDGVHLGQDDSSVLEAREILGPDKIIGLSTHNARQAEKAKLLPIQYIGVGPVFPSQTKPNAKEGGVEYLEYTLKNLKLPVVAIGGITIERIPELKQLGLRSLAMIQGLLAAKEPALQIQRVIAAIEA